MTAVAGTLNGYTHSRLWGGYSIRAGLAWEDEWIFGPVTLLVPLGIFYLVIGPWRVSLTWPVVLAD